jgi:hypothetical protein
LYVLDGGKALSAAVKSMPVNRRRSNAAKSISRAETRLSRGVKRPLPGKSL